MYIIYIVKTIFVWTREKKKKVESQKEEKHLKKDKNIKKKKSFKSVSVMYLKINV